ncbi:uncharacterized protein EAE97_006083 [Botrytis byssoidea]|uniref:Aminoglycoside phosphotransferase domain-containing protein n=1 Tax=Botrytis byssoidea TaxID=139641 RepID=A0A9P5INB1_9HELO|nr:uncharacterized protein EAE97_006083 [Botrytis byssoidea]KAF7942629.1 hypothetical protein EAE97_006083 [Botrytis byssoidea]
MSTNLKIRASDLPGGRASSMDFLNSSFFQNERGQCLPAPAEVFALSGDGPRESRPPPVIFEHLNLLVKFGRYVKIAEAQCLWIIKKDLGGEVPVPEIYGWRTDGDYVFIYMELIRGVTLKHQWDSMNDSDKTSVCEQLKKIVSSLRSVEQDPQDPFIGSLSRGHLSDIILENQPPGGPFAIIEQFNDYFSSLPWLPFTLPENFKDPWREHLPDDGSIKLTHGDLSRGNIIISPATPPRVLAIIDWAHCGWFPDYWEYCKAAHMCSYEGEWLNEWIPTFLTPWVEVYRLFNEYAYVMGAF